jgi:hypothetical protein
MRCLRHSSPFVLCLAALAMLCCACGGFGLGNSSSNANTGGAIPGDDITSSAPECVSDSACDDGKPCTFDLCVFGGFCMHADRSGPCDDGNACTLNDACNGGTCTGSDKHCDDHNGCTSDACGATACVHTPVSASCNDGDPCTQDDACVAGTCVGNYFCECASDGDCDDGTTCTSDSCAAQGHTCYHIALSGNCSDGSACTEADHCTDGVCNGTTKVCDDGNPCTVDSCSPSKGCVTAIGGSELPCDDGKACTYMSHCYGGACTATGYNNQCDCGLDGCDDNNACTADGCGANGKCANLPITCNDGNPCTTDVCDASTGKCTAVPVTSKAAMGACQPDVCSTGMLYCVAGAKVCQWTGATGGVETCSNGKGKMGTCSGGVCDVPPEPPPSIASATVKGGAVASGKDAVISVSVKDGDNDASKGTNDIASVTVDATAIGGGKNVALTPGAADGQSVDYSAKVSTAGLAEGVYFLPVTATDFAGASVTSLTALFVYTGQALHVGAGQPYDSIYAAIQNANDGDAVLVDDGTYTGVWNTNLAFGGKKILVMGVNSAATTLIDCENSGRAFNFHNGGEGAQSVVANFTMRNCAANAVRVQNDQDGVLPLTPQIVSCAFDHNTGTDAPGSIWVSGPGTKPMLALSTLEIADRVNPDGAAVALDSAAEMFMDSCTVTALQSSGSTVCLGCFSAGMTETILHVRRSQFSGTGASGMDAFRIRGPGKLDMHDSSVSELGRAIYSFADEVLDKPLDQTIMVSGCQFAKNASAVYAGGYIGLNPETQWLRRTITITDSQFMDHTGDVIDLSTSQIYNGGQVVGISGSRFFHNANRAVVAEAWQVSLSDDQFVANGYIGQSGAVDLGSFTTLYLSVCQYPAVIAGCVFDKNIGSSGGGLSFVAQSGSAFCANKPLRTLQLTNTVFTNNSGTYGGGLYIAMPALSNVATLENLLVAHNTASNSGGGIALAASTSGTVPLLGAKAATTLRAITIAGNSATYGGGVSVEGGTIEFAYAIITGNTAIASATGADVRVSTYAAGIGLTAQFTALATSKTNLEDTGAKLNDGLFGVADNKGNLILDDPLFTNGPDGDYYLAQTAAGQNAQSPCVDPKGPGVLSAKKAGFSSRTTRTDGIGEGSTLDMGYHHGQ